MDNMEKENTLPQSGFSSCTDVAAKDGCSRENPFWAPLISNERVTHSDHFQDVRLVRLDISCSGIRLVCFLGYLLIYACMEEC